MYSGKSGCIRAKWLYSGKGMVVFGKTGCGYLFVQNNRGSNPVSCIRAKVVVFVQSGSIALWAKVVCIRAKWLYSGKVVAFRQI